MNTVGVGTLAGSDHALRGVIPPLLPTSEHVFLETVFKYRERANAGGKHKIMLCAEKAVDCSPIDCAMAI